MKLSNCFKFETNFKKKICYLFYYDSKDYPPSTLEQNVTKIRKSVQGVMSEYQHYSNVVSDTINIGYEHSNCKYKT